MHMKKQTILFFKLKIRSLIFCVTIVTVYLKEREFLVTYGITELTKEIYKEDYSKENHLRSLEADRKKIERFIIKIEFFMGRQRKKGEKLRINKENFKIYAEVIKVFFKPENERVFNFFKKVLKMQMDSTLSGKDKFNKYEEDNYQDLFYQVHEIIGNAQEKFTHKAFIDTNKEHKENLRSNKYTSKARNKIKEFEATMFTDLFTELNMKIDYIEPKINLLELYEHEFNEARKRFYESLEETRLMEIDMKKAAGIMQDIKRQS